MFLSVTLLFFLKFFPDPSEKPSTVMIPSWMDVSVSYLSLWVWWSMWFDRDHLFSDCLFWCFFSVWDRKGFKRSFANEIRWNYSSGSLRLFHMWRFMCSSAHFAVVTDNRWKEERTGWYYTLPLGNLLCCLLYKISAALSYRLDLSVYNQYLTVIFDNYYLRSFSVDSLSLNQINEQQNQFIDQEGFHIHHTWLSLKRGWRIINVNYLTAFF